MNELNAYLCGWLTSRIGPLEPFVRWIDMSSSVQPDGSATYLPYFALGAAHGHGPGLRSHVPLLSSTAVIETIGQLGKPQARAACAQHDACGAPAAHARICRPVGPRCDVIREGRSGVGELVDGVTVFRGPRRLIDRLIDWIAADAAHARG
jgi:hypothetical protein